MKRLSIDKIMGFGQCESYSRERLEQLAPKGSLSIAEIAALPIPEEDRVWILLRPFVLGLRFFKVLRKIAQRSLDLYDFRLRYFEALLDPWMETSWIAMAAAEPCEKISEAVSRERKLQLQDIVETIQETLISPHNRRVCHV